MNAISLIRSACPGLMILLILAGVDVAPAGADDLDLRDLQHEVAVRATLAKDPRLEALNVIVRVKNRVATLSGSVPSRDLARRAVDTARQVPDIREVRDQMTVQLQGANMAMSFPPTRPTPALPDRLTLPPPTTPPGIAGAKKSGVIATGEWVPVSPAANEPPVKGVALLPWIIGQPGVGDPVSRSKDTPSSKAAMSLDSAAISSAMQSLVSGEERYRRLQFEVKQNKVYLSGTVYRWADLHELALAATRIPGVESVVLRDVKAESRK